MESEIENAFEWETLLTKVNNTPLVIETLFSKDVQAAIQHDLEQLLVIPRLKELKEKPAMAIQALQGNARDQCDYADSLTDDRKIKWYVKSAYQDYAEADYKLGCCYFNQGSMTLAQTWWERAVQKNHVLACNELGKLHAQQGHWDMAIGMFEKGATLGHLPCVCNLAISCRKKGNHARAIELLKTLVERENPDPRWMYAYGEICWKHGSEKEKRNAIDWLKKAAAQGDKQAVEWLRK